MHRLLLMNKLLLVLSVVRLSQTVMAFHVAFPRLTRSRSRQLRCFFPLHMASSKAQNKQAALRQKMEAAKRQNQDGITEPEIATEKSGLSDKEIRERNDLLRFEELLRNGAANVLNDYSSDGYLNRQQEEEEIDAVRKCLFVAVF